MAMRVVTLRSSALLLVLLLGVAGLVWVVELVGSGGHSARSFAGQSAAPKAGSDALPTSRGAPGRALPVAEAPGAAASAAVSQREPRANTAALATTRTCAGVPLQFDAQGAVVNNDALSAEPAAQAVAAMRAGLTALHDDRSRAVALSFDPLGSQAATPMAPFASYVPARLPASPATDALAALAARSNDAMVYALGFQACLRYSGANAPAAPNCAQISAAQWARLEPDNAVPWLYQANLTKEAGHAAGPAELIDALQHIAHAHRFDTHAGAAQQLMLGSLPSGTPPEVEVASAIALLGQQAALWQPGYWVISQACKGDALRDANRRQSCSEVASAFVERADSMMELTIGRNIAERVGWPAARVAALRREEAALSKAVATELGTDFVSCAGATRSAAFLRDRAARGELPALRRLLPNATQPGGADPISPVRGVSR